MGEEGIEATVVETGLPLGEGEAVVAEVCPMAESQPVQDISTPGIIVGRLCFVASPLPFVIIAGGWPSALIRLLALDLPIQSAYFPTQLHKYFNPFNVWLRSGRLLLHFPTIM